MWLDALSTTFAFFVFTAKGAKESHAVLLFLSQKHVTYKLRKKKTVLQSMNNRTIEIGRYNGTEINEKKFKVMRNSRQPS